MFVTNQQGDGGYPHTTKKNLVPKNNSEKLKIGKVGHFFEALQVLGNEQFNEEREITKVL